jgi:hypothetical protein
MQLKDDSVVLDEKRQVGKLSNKKWDSVEVL